MSCFTGYVIREEKDSAKGTKENTESFESDSDDDDFESADQDFDFLRKPSRKLRNVVENMKEMEFKHGHFIEKPGITRVRGQFDRLFSHSWWKAEMKINAAKSSKKDKLASSLPSYSYRTDDGVGEDVLSLFLREGCEVHPQHVALLLEFIRRSNLRPTLDDLMGNLEKFANSSEDANIGDVARQIQTSLHHSPMGKAFTFPVFTKFAHRLFPRHVCSIFDEWSQKKLESLSEALQEESWIFGYWTILKNRYGLSGCEVKLSSFIECDLLQEMPIVKQDALRIYDALSRMIRKNGHTYVLLSQLKRQKADVTTWAESLAYLSQINVVKTSEDHLGDERHVFLTHIRGFEKKIAKNLAEIMDKEPWIGNIEIDEQIFGGDEDQVKAAKLITQSPVVVMSGRGGCGKTFVVSKVLSKALEIKRRRVILDHLVNVDDVNVNTPESGNEADEVETLYPSPDVTIQLTEDSDHSSDRDGYTINQDLQDDPADTSNIDPVPQVNEQPFSEDDDDDEVLLTAPTGKAASILGKRTRLSSYTLHSVIYSRLRWEKQPEKQEGKPKGDWEFSKVRLLVCDECSLISVRVFSKLLSILCEWSQLQQIILLGDINQLPSIEPGNFLSDIYDSLKPYGVSISLTTNHRAESELIVRNAIKISNKQMPLFDPQRGFLSIEYQSKRNDNDSESNKITQVVKDVLQGREKPFVLPDPYSSQFVAFRRNDCNIINEQCALHYNSHSIKDERGKPNFQVGDKVCVRRNSECFDAYGKKPVKLCNGEIFFIKDIIEEIDEQKKKKNIFYSLDNGEKIMKIDFGSLKTAKLSHAWARTIHTFQGSEIDTVVYMVGLPYYQNWQHVYTAVTRGVRQVIMINNPSSLWKSIKSLPVRRQTKLEKDMEQAMKNRRHPDAHDEGLKTTNTQFATQSGVVHMNAFASVQPFDSVPDVDGKDEALTSETSSSEHGRHLDAAASSGDFLISRQNLRIKKLKPDQDEHRGLAASSRNGTSYHGIDTQPYQELMPMAASGVSDLQSPGHKRKHPESTIFLSPPQTPPHFKKFPSALSSVSPFNQTSKETQQAVASQQSADNIPARKTLVAQYDGVCRVCQDRIRSGTDTITYDRKGSNKYWIHEGCATSDQL